MKNSVLCDYWGFSKFIITKWGTFAPTFVYLSWMYLNELMQ